jgi:hypothetical protein
MMVNYKNLSKIITIICFLQLIILNDAYAQAGAAAPAGDEDIYGESLKDVTTVAAIGLGGAILGLSTLSFVEEPKDHMKNIVVGGALGVIIGVGWVAYTQATKSKQSYEQNSYIGEPKLFGTSERLGWHSNKQFQNFAKKNPLHAEYVRYSFTF